MRRGTLLSPSLPHKRRVLRLQPLSHCLLFPLPISAAGALRYDPLQTQLAGLGEHERSIGRRASLNRMPSTWTTRKLVSPLLERTLWARRESGLAGGLDSCPLSLRRLKPDPAMTGDGRGQAIPYSGLKRRSAYCNRGHAIGRAWIHA